MGGWGGGGGGAKLPKENKRAKMAQNRSTESKGVFVQIVCVVEIQFESASGLEKLTNANRSISKVNEWLFLVELTEIADWESRFEYMLHLNFGGKNSLTRVIGGKFGAHTFPIK